MGTWKLDPYHTQVEFSVKHLGMMTVRGHFAEVSASGDIRPDAPEQSSVEVTVNTKSIRTHNETRDNDLRSSNFLGADEHPTMTFKSTLVQSTGSDSYDMTGDLTIKGHTKPVTLHVTRYGEFNDPNMGHRIGYAAEGRINRKDYGMQFEMMLDGRFVVGNDVNISIEGELVEAPEEAPATAG